MRACASSSSSRCPSLPRSPRRRSRPSYAVEIGHEAIGGLLMGAGPAGIVIELRLLPLLIPEQGPRHVAVLSVLSCAPLALFVLMPGPAVALVLIVVSGISLYFF